MRPSGTVTFLTSDIEGSTRLLRTLGVDRYEAALQAHRALMREAGALGWFWRLHSHFSEGRAALAQALAAAMETGAERARALAAWDKKTASARPAQGVHYPVNPKTLPPGVKGDDLVTVAHVIDGEVVGGITYSVGARRPPGKSLTSNDRPPTISLPRAVST